MELEQKRNSLLSAGQHTGKQLQGSRGLGLDVDGALPPARDILSAFRMDKKFHGGVRLVLLREVGHPTVVDGVTDEELRDVLNEMGATA